MTPAPEPLFLRLSPDPLGPRFALYHAPSQRRTRGLVVYIHPLAEEMNKSRRMAALQSRALANAGFAVLQMDLLGCGDSAGDFGDATWAQWVGDVSFACGWLRQRHNDAVAARSFTPPLWLWGLRAGCLLAADAALQLPQPCHFLFWQPPPSGKALLQQFLRLKAASELFGDRAKEVMAQLRSQLAAGQPVEVAGYTLHPGLCHGLERAMLHAPAWTGAAAGRVEWLEVSPLEDAALSPAAAGATQWTQAGWAVRAHLAHGPAFWQTTEIEDAPALLAATLAAVFEPAEPSAVPAAHEPGLGA